MSMRMTTIVNMTMKAVMTMKMVAVMLMLSDILSCDAFILNRPATNVFLPPAMLPKEMSAHLRTCCISRTTFAENGLKFHADVLRSRSSTALQISLNRFHNFDITQSKVDALFDKIEELGIKLEEIEESFVRGSGAGGQKINKTANNVQMKHIPTGLQVSCQREREREKNRFIALRQLVEKIELSKSGQVSKADATVMKKRKQKARRKRRSKSSAERQDTQDESEETDDQEEGDGKNLPKPIDVDDTRS
eukprot:766146-Hanusia_phi.AAC.1